MRDELVLAHGTSFFFGYEGSDYLVTARHNLTGRNPETDEPVSRSAVIPNQLEILIVVPAAPGEATADKLLVTDKRLRIPFDALSDEGSGLGAYGHPDDATVDVACVGPFAREEDMVTRAVNHEFYELTKLQVSAGDDAFVLGYPHFVDGGTSFLPVWKRASVASYPQSVDNLGLPRRLLLDTATRRGMSGAPVFVRQSGFIVPSPAFQRDAMLGDEIIGTAMDFLGCYSGRLGEKDALDSQLGIVWTWRAIEETLQARKTLDLGM